MSESIANRLVFTNLLWMVAEKGIRLVLSILVIGLVARHLGAEFFGQLNFAIAVLAIAIVIASVGMNRIVPREVVGSINNELQRSEIVSTAFFIRLAAALLVLMVLFVSVCLFTNQNLTLFFLVIVSILFSPFDVIDLHQQGLARVKGISIIRSLVFIAASLAKISLVLLDANVVWFFALVLFEHGALAVSFYRFIHKKNGKDFLSLQRCKWIRVTSTLRESWPEVIAGLGGILFMRLDQVMLQFMQGAESVGIYSAAVRISEAWYFLPVAIIATTFPKIIQLREESEERYMDAMLMLFSALAGISIAAVVFFQLFSEQVVGIVFGKEFSESALILKVHCLTTVFIVMGLASGSWLAAERRLILNLYRNLFGLTVNIAFNFVLIGRYGALGAALATLISAICAYYIFDLFSPTLRFIFKIKSQAILTLGICGVMRARRCVSSRRP
ncbi:flippase [Marinobacter sp. 1Y8]